MGDYEEPYDDDQDYYADDYNDDDDDDDDDDRDFIDGYPDAQTEFSTAKDSNCQVITKESLLAAQKEDSQRVMDLLTLKEHHTRTLLIHYRWDVDKVFAVLVEKGKEKLYAEAGVVVRDGDDNLTSIHCSSEIFCEICMEDVPANSITRMDCGHCFCNNCWTEHFVVKINEGQSRRISCMAHKCDAICDEGKVRNLVSARDPDMAEKFNRFLLESYIEDNKRVKWCPSVPHCGNAIRVDGDEYCEVECACGMQFCFSCSSEAHSPCSCLMWGLWTSKCMAESETINWMVVNTKQCPKCHKPVEKNGGCNLVMCICGQAFCLHRSTLSYDYLIKNQTEEIFTVFLPGFCLVGCGGPTGTRHTWESIEDHTCGRYKEGLMKDAEKARSELSRYIHYHNWYKAHTDSFKAEVNLKEKIQAEISKMENVLELKDYSWLTNGVYRLFRSRRILSYSYPFAYYMFGKDLLTNEMTKEEKLVKQNLFEDQQQQLEANVEKLSMCLEKPMDGYSEKDVAIMRTEIRRLTMLTDNLCQKLYECIDNDLLPTLGISCHIIAPYRSKGAEKAVELHDK